MGCYTWLGRGQMGHWKPMKTQVNSEIDHMSHALPWHMTGCSPEATFAEIRSRLRRISINIHSDRSFGTRNLCRMA
eukprot:6247914-Prorocentrum_lima.AAC.1